LYAALSSPQSCGDGFDPHNAMGTGSRPVRKSFTYLVELFFFYMPFFVYIIVSLQNGTFYKGFSLNPVLRLKQHNDGLSKYTSKFKPWKLVFVEQFSSKSDALIREKNLKKATNERILALIDSPKNIVKTFIP
jgi:putative endonuclease